MSQNKYRILNEIKELRSLIKNHCVDKSFKTRLIYIHLQMKVF